MEDNVPRGTLFFTFQKIEKTKMNIKEYIISGNIIDIIKKEIYPGSLTISNGKIKNINKTNTNSGNYILPGFIDSHVHIESSMLVPSEFAKIAVRHGTVATVSDPHEIANIMGVKGVEFMISNGNTVPFKFNFGAPSCVPATEFETSGEKIGSKEIKTLLVKKEIVCLAEVMNYRGVINADNELHKKINLSKKFNKKIDGHAPGLFGKDLEKYIKAGITTDHESINIKEAVEKINNGMKIQIREGSAAKNFNELHELIDRFPEMIMLCTDDIHPEDLQKSHINDLVIRGRKYGLNIYNLLRAASFNPIKHYNLDVGLLQINDPADFIVVEDLESFKVLATYINGIKVYENGKVLFSGGTIKRINKFNREPVDNKSVEIESKASKINVIEANEGQLFTKRKICEAKINNNKLICDIEKDLLKIIVISRYNNQEPAVGFIKGFKLKKGAIASSIAHDSHNIVAVGTNDNDLVTAVNKIIELKGGLVAVHNKTIQYLSLEIAGIMSDQNVFSVAKTYNNLNKTVQEFGSTLKSPYMTLSFMALLVIPELKIGDKGLFDVNKFQFISLFNE